MNHETIGIRSPFDSTVNTQLHRRIYRREERGVARILHIFVYVCHEARSSVGSIIDYSVRIGAVRYASECLRIHILVLKPCKIQKYVSCRIPLAGTEYRSGHGNKHIAAPILVEPRQSGIDAIALLAGDKLVGSQHNPCHGPVKRVIVGDQRI